MHSFKIISSLPALAAFTEAFHTRIFRLGMPLVVLLGLRQWTFPECGFPVRLKAFRIPYGDGLAQVFHLFPHA